MTRDLYSGSIIADVAIVLNSNATENETDIMRVMMDGVGEDGQLSAGATTYVLVPEAIIVQGNIMV